MAAGFDLQVDTDRLRRCAAIVSGAAQDLLTAGRGSGEATGAAVGGSATADEVGALLRVKAEQAAGAAAQLGAVTSAVAQHLQASAAHFERADTAMRGSAR
ncbi:Excreted virulence factor EspC, type VII ESX diderm [Nakamurella panacisegetis]|uniref:Excreted virulence factor EspC, type VII ESX diderm n=1 Tax=Nakamurella panacisegetis TaxID=1090615 RepID=A0A1H0SN02_9ACTN|nr:type VII secretion target [Nakamurella panacisegetis]SDP43073.1 Excreted virulence factor EspC, type VII ESX diderm [Nakamurella panacisegetis]